ncbi:MAG TPA: hypothetical protein HPP97_13065 [Desulfuromonadales bacterium]|nr:hypothetical protein [Desulfuromonadales bacterium]
MRLLAVAFLCMTIFAQSAFANENASPAFYNKSPAEHLADAKRFLKYGQPHVARIQLDAIPKTAPEYKEAQRIYAKLPALEKKEAGEDIKYEAVGQIEDRKNFAKYYETELDYKGIRGTVSVQGKGNTTLKINCALRKRLANDNKLLSDLRRLKFKKLLISDGVTLTTVTLN